MKRGPHILVAAQSGTGKSNFASTIIQKRNPRPVLVQGFDPSDKLTRYRMRADRIKLETWQYGERELLYKDDKLVAVIERWHEKQGHGSGGITMKGGKNVGTARYVNQGVMFEKYLERMKDFVDECEDWYALVHDSTTFAEFGCRQYLSGRMKVRDNQMIWAQATDELERLYIALFPDLPITTIVLSHATVERAKNESNITAYEVRLPGRLSRDIIASFGEVYRAYVVHTREGAEYFMQTTSDGIWRCSSQLDIPSPMGPNPSWREVYEAAIAVRPEGEEE